MRLRSVHSLLRFKRTVFIIVSVLINSHTLLLRLRTRVAPRIALISQLRPPMAKHLLAAEIDRMSTHVDKLRGRASPSLDSHVRTIVNCITLKLRNLKDANPVTETDIQSAIDHSSFTQDHKNELSDVLSTKFVSMLTAVSSDEKGQQDFTNPLAWFTDGDWAKWRSNHSDSSKCATMVARLLLLDARYLKERNFGALGAIILSQTHPAGNVSGTDRKAIVDTIKQGLTRKRTKRSERPLALLDYSGTPQDLSPEMFAAAYPVPSDPPVTVEVDNWGDWLDGKVVRKSNRFYKAENAITPQLTDVVRRGSPQRPMPWVGANADHQQLASMLRG